MLRPEAASVLNECDRAPRIRHPEVFLYSDMFKVHQPAERFGLSSALAATPGRASAELWLPTASLASCVRAVLARDTRDLDLSDEQRYNHLPASPVCSITWYFHGDGEMLAPGGVAAAATPRRPLPGRIFFAGPFTGPSISWNPGPAHAMMLLFMPDAFHALTGIDPGTYVDQLVPAVDVFDDDWMALCREVATAPDDAARVARIEAFLEPRWRARRPDAALPVRLFADWSHHLAMRAANSGLGRSLRQTERRIKQWTGQPLRELRGLGRSERAFFEALAAIEKDALNWTDVAANAGYTDQSHLCRQTRRITGFAPDELRHRIATDEGFWAYRLWGFSETAVE